METILLLNESGVAPYNLSEHLPIVTYSCPPKEEDVALYQYYYDMMEKQPWGIPKKRVLEKGALLYLKSYTYFDTFNTHHIERKKYNLLLRDNYKEIAAVYFQNRLTYDFMTWVLNSRRFCEDNVEIFREAKDLGETLQTQAIYESMNYDLKIEVSEKVLTFAKFVCARLLTVQ